MAPSTSDIYMLHIEGKASVWPANMANHSERQLAQTRHPQKM